MILVLATLLAGTLRGFAGFGTAMVMTPAFSAILGPAQGVGLCLALECAVAVPLLPGALRMVDWRRIGGLLIAAVSTVPFGAWVLVRTDGVLMRRILSLLVLACVVVLASGWRFRGRATTLATLLAGAVGGFLNGLAGMAGPPVVFYYFASDEPAAAMRANLTTLFAIVDMVALGSVALRTEVPGDILGLALILAPCIIVGGLLGQRLFPLASERFYKRLALSILAVVALTSLVA